MDKCREEKEIFYELQKLCSVKGYAHVIAYYCFKDSIIKFEKDLKPENFKQFFKKECLVRNEISTLIGLLVKNKIELLFPKANGINDLIKNTDLLLDELHRSIYQSTELVDDVDDNRPLANGMAMREPIIYNGESAYNFQYWDFAIKKYNKDNVWLKTNKGFSIHEANEVVKAIQEIQGKKLLYLYNKQKEKEPSKMDILNGFLFTISDIRKRVNINRKVIKNILIAFSIPSRTNNSQFKTISDFNIINAYPVIKLGYNKYLVFQIYNLSEALYETPYYWMIEDKEYKNTAMKNRGDFAEIFSSESLRKVFGKDRVFSNVNILDSKKKNAGEIDVLVTYANRVIILQAKTKRLTLEARKGNDNVIKNDFKKGIQASYNQALLCSKLITDEKYSLCKSDGEKLEINRDIKEIYIFCLVSDHYPAISFQAKEFLIYEKSKKIMPPFVMDIFLLDVMTELLSSPLLLLNYISKRAIFYENVMATRELSILSFHLRNGLWINNLNSLLYLGEDMDVDVDIAMLSRRGGLPGKKTPEGILTIDKKNVVGKILEQIEIQEDSTLVDIGFLLSQLNETFIKNLSENIETLTKLSCKDNKHHDMTMVLDSGNVGFTVHCSTNFTEESKESLNDHCLRRKYLDKAKKWYGIFIDPQNYKIKYGLSFENDWNWSKDMENKTKNFIKSHCKVLDSSVKFNDQEIGRNSKCPCGSGKKYKKCCGKEEDFTKLIYKN